MARRELTFRVFVSSTFSDLIAERNALQEHVFPEVRSWCEARGARFQPIDLRWGVHQQASLNQQTMTICMQELTRCQTISPRPNFIVLLGDRYGWRPLPPSIQAEEFELLTERLDEQSTVRLAAWYRRDDNAIPADYRLMPRSGEFTEADRWAQEEQELRDILLTAVDLVFAVEDPRRRRYETSATHQEIRAGALDPGQSPNNVLCYFRAVQELPTNDSAGPFRDIVNGTVDEDSLARLSALKDDLRRRLPPNNIRTYEARWESDRPAYDLQALCEDVKRDLKSLIEQELADFSQQSAQEHERESQREFAEERCRHFAGRQDVLGRIGDYIASDSTEPLVIYGRSGCGKSAILAKSALTHADPATAAADCVSVSRFIGATPGSSDLKSLLSDLCRELGVQDIPHAMDELVRSFRDRLVLPESDVSPGARPVILILDALDQLKATDGAHRLQWLPRELGPHVRLIISVLQADSTDGEPGGDDPCAIAGRIWPDALVEVGGLDESLAPDLLNAWLAESRRTLQPDQRAELLDRFARCPLPLYLKLAAGEACCWRSWEGVAERLPGTVDGILTGILARLERPEHHGEALVRRALSYLGSSRNGLTEDELLDLLSREQSGVMEQFFARSPESPRVNRLPIVVWSRLYAELESLITRRSADGTVVFDFYHRQVQQAVTARYLSGEAQRDAHRNLAEYFEEQPLWSADLGLQVPARRAAAERAWLQTQAGMLPELTATLTGFSFVMAKFAAGMLDDLEADYRHAAAVMPDADDVLGPWRVFFREQGHFLRRESPLWPVYKILLQRAVEYADESPVTQAAERWLEQGHCDWVWLRSLHRPRKLPTDPCLRVVEVPGGVGNVELLADGRVLSWTSDRKKENCMRLILWRVGGEGLEDVLDVDAMLEGHDGAVSGVYQIPDHRLVSWAADGTIRVWDLNTNREHCCLRYSPADSDDPTTASVRGDGVEWVRQLADGQLLVSPTGRACLDVWDPENGTHQVAFDLNGRTASHVVELPDGNLLAVLGGPPVLCIWDRQTGARIATMGHEQGGHVLGVSGVQVLTDGRIVTWSGDRTLRLWNLDERRVEHVLRGHTAAPTEVLELPNGFLLSFAGMSGHEEAVHVWNPDRGVLHTTLGENTGQTRTAGVLVLAGGHIVLASHSRSSDASNTLEVWDPVSGEEVLVIDNGVLKIGIAEVVELPEDRIAISHGRKRQIWNVQSGQMESEQTGSLGRSAGLLLPLGRMLTSSSDALRLWQLDAPDEESEGNGNVLSETDFPEQTAYAEATAFGDHQAIVSTRGMRRLWDARDGTIVATWKYEEAWVRDNLLYLERPDKTVDIWDIRRGEIQKHLDVSIKQLRQAAGSFKINPLPDSSFEVRDADTDELLHTLEGHRQLNTSARKSKHDVDLDFLVLDDGTIAAWNRNAIRIWNLESGELLLELEGHTKEVAGVAQLANGQLVSWAKDRTIRVWEPGAAVACKVIEDPTREVDGVMALSETRLVSWGLDETLRVWDITGGELQAVLSGHLARVKGALRLSDGRIVSWDADNCLIAWDQACESVRSRLQDDGGEFWELEPLPDGTLMFSGLYREISRWNPCREVLDTLPGTKGRQHFVPLADGRFLSWDNWAAMISDPDSGRERVDLHGHRSDIWRAIEVSDDRIVTCSWDTNHYRKVHDFSIRIWNSQTGELLTTIPTGDSAVFELLELADGRFLSQEHGSFRVWDVRDGAHVATWEGFEDSIKDVRQPSDGRVVSRHSEGTLCVWDGTATQPVREFDASGRAGWKMEVGLNTRHLRDDRLATWVSLGYRGYQFSSDKSIRIWNLRTGILEHELTGHTNKIASVRQLRSGRLASYAVDREEIRLWDRETGQQVGVLDVGRSTSIRVEGLEELPDRLLRVWYRDADTRLWNPETAEEVACFKGCRSPLQKLSDGRVVGLFESKGLVSSDTTSAVWESMGGPPVSILDSEIRTRETIELPDGMLLSWSTWQSRKDSQKDDFLYVWDPDTGKCLAGAPVADAYRLLPSAWAARLQTDDKKCGLVRSSHVGWDTQPLAGITPIQGEPADVIAWQADNAVEALVLFADGTLLVSRKYGELPTSLRFLKLYSGAKRVSLQELSAIDPAKPVMPGYRDRDGL